MYTHGWMYASLQIDTHILTHSSDRDQILENFRTLEDDHAAVKYSLLQQLQQRPNNRAEVTVQKDNSN